MNVPIQAEQGVGPDDGRARFEARVRAAASLAWDGLTATAIAQRLGVCRRVTTAWRHHPVYWQTIDERAEAIRQQWREQLIRRDKRHT